MIVSEWLSENGFSAASFGWSMCVHAEGITVDLLQGYPDDPKAADDQVSLTSLPRELTVETLVSLLKILGAKQFQNNSENPSGF